MSDRLLGNTLISMYVKCGNLIDARKVFDRMSEGDVCSWTVMIAAYGKYGPAEEALQLFEKMQPKPNSFTFASVISACANLRFLDQGVQIHKEVIKRGFEFHISVTNALIDMYAKCCKIDKARQLFDKMSQPNVVSCTSMITGYAYNRLVDEALKVFQQMPQRDVFSWNAMLAGYLRNGLTDEATVFFKGIPCRDTVSWNVMIAGYAQNGLVDEALHLFEEMPQPSIVAWNAVIAGYAQSEHSEQALQIFHQMQSAGIKPNSKTFVSVLPACANLTALEQGIEIHDKIIASGFQYDEFVMSALIDMYAKCGNIEKARELFDKIHRQDVVCWTTMISGYAMNGCAQEALKLFEQMKCSGTSPNHVTFLSVLTACSHAGLVEEGFQCLNSMVECYHIEPGIAHYRCTVDLLCRAGRLDEAQDFIHKMPVKPDVAVWSCLLNACRLYNNIELGKQAADCIFKLEPTDATPYVVLSNIYAAADRWDDTEKVRKFIKNRGLKKAPGCSWIEINKQVHAFLSPK
ncbi:pentatricopeptide repeat-containing protein At4g02750 [Cryptomeria japonica]|uniref:pentatricopeptide repeat-containing protein At4g02750 n=1 Tax=Cryptomeria japonica TaxID=3369 RepID=UPI0027DA713D|nr:pentatricopeptide repeat-containing protein At4g02750 [Cryptomeria japonica]